MTKVLCAGGPLAGRELDVAAPEKLPLRVALPYWREDPTATYMEVAGPEEPEARTAYYVPTRVVLFDRQVWVLLHDQIHGDEGTRNLAIAQVLLSEKGLAAWSSGKVRPNGH